LGSPVVVAVCAATLCGVASNPTAAAPAVKQTISRRFRFALDITNSCNFDKSAPTFVCVPTAVGGRQFPFSLLIASAGRTSPSLAELSLLPPDRVCSALRDVLPLQPADEVGHTLADEVLRPEQAETYHVFPLDDRPMLWINAASKFCRLWKDDWPSQCENGTFYCFPRNCALVWNCALVYRLPRWSGERIGLGTITKAPVTGRSVIDPLVGQPTTPREEEIDEGEQIESALCSRLDEVRSSPSEGRMTVEGPARRQFAICACRVSEKPNEREHYERACGQFPFDRHSH